MAEARSGRRFAGGWQAVRAAGPQRIALTALLLLAALLGARFSWFAPFTDEAERALYDYRAFITAPLVEQDDRILLVVYDDQTLIDLKKRSPLDRAMLARALANLDAMSAKSIGIDILFDQPQDEDEQLIATLRAMQTPVSVAYADVASNQLDIVHEQQAFLDGFIARLEGSRAQPASIRLSAETGVTRIWPERVAGLPPMLAQAMLQSAGEPQARAFAGYAGAIRFRRPALVEYPVFTSLNISLFADPAIAAALAPQVAGRHVLIGGDIVDYDRAMTPFSRFDDDTSASGVRDVRPPGIEIHAEVLAQMLDGARLAPVPGWMLWALALAVVLAAALTAMLELKRWQFAVLLLAQLALFVALPFWLAGRGVDTYGFPAIGPALGWVIAFAAVLSAVRAATDVQRRFAQGALGKYLPREMAQQIIDQPELLALHGESREIYVLFSDLEGFTQMSHAIPPETVARLLNRYLDMLSQVVLDHGGVIDKFVGDAVVAFWGAPIARPDDGIRAARAGYAMWQAGEAFRAEVAAMDAGLPKIGKTRVGLHWGEAVVGNFGGATRIQYTALGDSMNTAARLESANKALGSSVMASREFAERSGLDWWRPMGRIVLRGRAAPVDIFEPAPDFPAADRRALADALAMLATDKVQALAAMAALVARHPADKALANLLERCRSVNGDDAHVLG